MRRRGADHGNTSHWRPDCDSRPEMRELFIYYRSPEDQAAEVLRRVHGFQAGLTERHAGLVARLLRRPGSIEGAHTWMETYSMDTMYGGVGTALQQEIEAAAACLRGCITGERHTEVFEPCAW
jgi:Domain of unknown function (DUF4936)